MGGGDWPDGIALPIHVHKSYSAAETSAYSDLDIEAPESKHVHIFKRRRTLGKKRHLTTSLASKKLSSAFGLSRLGLSSTALTPWAVVQALMNECIALKAEQLPALPTP
jgi:hypothetical protein